MKPGQMMGLWLINLERAAPYLVNCVRAEMMRTLKRQTANQLRQHAPKGRKVLYVWDRAGIDFRQWNQWKDLSGIYPLS